MRAGSSREERSSGCRTNDQLVACVSSVFLSSISSKENAVAQRLLFYSSRDLVETIEIHLEYGGVNKCRCDEKSLSS